MSFNKLSKDSSMNSKNESLNYRSHDYLNPNQIIKDDNEDVLELLKIGNPRKKSSIFPNVNDHVNPNFELRVDKIQEMQINKLNLSKNNRDNNAILDDILKDNKQSMPTISSNSSRSGKDSRENSKRIDYVSRKKSSLQSMIDSQSDKSNCKSVDEEEQKITENKVNQKYVEIKTEENNNKQNLTTNDLTPHKNFDLYNNNNEEIKDQINEVLNFREIEKLKLSKRRQSINIRRRSLTERKKNMEINSAAMENLMNKDNENSKDIKYKKFIKYIDILIAIIVCVNIAISIIDNEIYISKSDKFLKEYTQANNITIIDLKTLSKIAERPISSEENFLRFINILVVSSNIIFIYIHYHLKVKVLQLNYRLSEYENIFTSGYYKYCLIEMIICGIFYPPYVNRVLSGTMLNLIYVYNLNGLISFIVMLKCYIILRVYSYFSRWTSEAASSICNKYNVRPGVHFAVKAELKKRTYTMLTLMMLISLTILSFALRTFEYGVKDPENTTSLKGDNDLQSLLNCFWLIIITMTTVGYGDLFPKSHLGRFIGVVACIIGMLIVSLIVVSLAVIAEFTSEEKKAYSLLKKLQADDNAYNKAIHVVVGILKLKKLVHKSKQKKHKNTLSERFILLTTLKKEISIFKNDYKIANSYSLPIDEMLKKLESKLKGDIQQLTTNIKKLSNVEVELDKISSKQDNIRQKIEVVFNRQDKISRYLVGINNRNFKKMIIKNYKEKFMKKQIESNKEENDKEINSSLIDKTVTDYVEN